MNLTLFGSFGRHFFIAFAEPVGTIHSQVFGKAALLPSPIAEGPRFSHGNLDILSAPPRSRCTKLSPPRWSAQDIFLNVRRTRGSTWPLDAATTSRSKLVSTLRRLALVLLKKHTSKESIARKRYRASMDELF